MKILWISHTSTLFGAERCLVEFLQATSKEHENYLVLPDHKGKLSEFAAPYIKGSKVIPTDWWVSPKTPTLKRYLIKYKYVLSSVFKIKNYIKEIGADLVITNTFTTIHGALGAQLAAVPHIYYIHEYVEEDHNFSFDWGAKFSTSLANKLTKVFFVNAVGVKRKFEKYLPKDKLQLLYYIINVTNNSKVTILQNKHKLELLLPAGRVEASKGQMDAVQAMNVLKTRMLDVHLTIFGITDNDYSLGLLKYVKDNALSSMVTVLKFAEDPFVYFNRADICLVTSRMEAFGRTTVEAMKLGKPVIGTNSGETQYLINAGKTGFLYEYGDYNQLANHIEFCYQNPDDVANMKVNASDYANSTFNANEFMKNFTSIVAKIK